MIRRVACVGLTCIGLTCAGLIASAETPTLESAMDLCRQYAEGDTAAFAHLGTPRPDPTDPAVAYLTQPTDAGAVTVKLIEVHSTCWLLGARFDPDGRRTTVEWQAVSARTDAWAHDPQRGPYISADTLAKLEFGTNTLACLGDGLARQLTATGGGTDDEARALNMSMKTYDSDWCR